MPTRKQRRKREKLSRHEYEEVFVDEEGRVLDPEEVEELALPDQKAPVKGGGSSRQVRGVREVPPPSWRRSVRRLAIFAPLMFAVIWFVDQDAPTTSKLFVGAFYTVLFIPFIYLTDRFAYRSYLRRLERERAKKK